MKGLRYGGKHNYEDFGLILNSFIDSGVDEKVIRDSVPFMHGSYDFSTVGSNGEPIYTDRKMKAVFTLKYNTISSLRAKHNKIVSWLMEGYKELIDDNQPDVTYNAKVETYPSIEDINGGRFEVEFIADSFKKGVSLEGSENILWDTFNFETDYMAPTQFNVDGTQVVSLYNSGRIVTPEVVVSTEMTCTLNGYTATFTPTKKKDWYFRLKPGQNQVTITGAGTIKFNWRKEVL